LRVISLTAHDDVALINFQSRAVGQFPVELAFGAFDETCWPLTSTFTLGGMTIGCFPMRDMAKEWIGDGWIGGWMKEARSILRYSNISKFQCFMILSPDITDEFAAEVFLRA